MVWRLSEIIFYMHRDEMSAGFEVKINKFDFSLAHSEHAKWNKLNVCSPIFVDSGLFSF